MTSKFFNIKIILQNILCNFLFQLRCNFCKKYDNFNSYLNFKRNLIDIYFCIICIHHSINRRDIFRHKLKYLQNTAHSYHNPNFYNNYFTLAHIFLHKSNIYLDFHKFCNKAYNFYILWFFRPGKSNPDIKKYMKYYLKLIYKLITNIINNHFHFSILSIIHDI